MVHPISSAGLERSDLPCRSCGAGGLKEILSLGSTPLGLILSATDLAGLQVAFQLQAEPARDGLHIAAVA